MAKKNKHYSIELKLEAIRLREEGFSVKDIQGLLGIKSESQVYSWWYWYRDGESERLSQPIGRPKRFPIGVEGKTNEELLEVKNRILETQIKILKKYEKMERKWYQR